MVANAGPVVSGRSGISALSSINATARGALPLLRGGIAPRQVERLLLELKAHAAALLDEEIARGQTVEVARAVARSRLGSDDETRLDLVFALGFPKDR